MHANPSLTAKAWPFEEARALLTRIERLPVKKDAVLFETGYGPSGLPHIGTFGEVARTSMVRHAFEVLTEGKYKTRLICFSDDKDGLRKVPDNLPNTEMIKANIGKPLTSIPDPFGTHESFGHHMNARLRAFLDTFGFDYEFKSSTETYASGEFDHALLNILKNYDKVMEVMLPTLGDERAETYSPFLPVSPISGKVLLAKVVKTDVAKGTITYIEEDGSEMEIPVTGGNCKLQWKPDMGMRWAALGVDYEMYGKDHLASAPLYDAISTIAGGTPPQQMMFELFLDANGQKISKSKGNGITIDEWLTYAPEESLALYMFINPRRAKKLHFDVIPQQVDDYLSYLEKYVAEVAAVGQPVPEGKQANSPLDNPVWHIHGGKPPAPESNVKFSMLMQLVSACNAEDKAVLWSFLKREVPDATPENSPMLDKLCGFAVRYYHDFVKATKKFRAPNETERSALMELREYLVEISSASATHSASPTGEATRLSEQRELSRSGEGMATHSSPSLTMPSPNPLPRGEGASTTPLQANFPTAEEIQTRIYDLGMKYYSKETMREWFKAMYETLLGSQQGPRMGSFIALFGAAGTIGLIDAALGQKVAA